MQHLQIEAFQQAQNLHIFPLASFTLPSGMILVTKHLSLS